MAWRRSGDKTLSEPVMVSLMTPLSVTLPQWVNVSRDLWQHIEGQPFQIQCTLDISRSLVSNEVSKDTIARVIKSFVSSKLEYEQSSRFFTVVFCSTSCYIWPRDIESLSYETQTFGSIYGLVIGIPKPSMSAALIILMAACKGEDQSNTVTTRSHITRYSMEHNRGKYSQKKIKLSTPKIHPYHSLKCGV